MTSSYYPGTTDHFYDKIQSHSMPSTNKNSTDDDDDDDLDALRKAALQTLYSKKRKNNCDHSRNSRSSSRSYSSSSRSSYTHSSISRSYSSSSLSSISSNSLDKNDKDYRFELKEKPSTADIDERFPNDNDDMLIVNCPIQDDDLLVKDEQQKQTASVAKKTSVRDERKAPKSQSKRRKSPPFEPPVSITVKLKSEEFDLRQLIKKRRTDDTSSNNHRVVQILPKDNQTIVHKAIHDRLSSSRSSQKYPKH